MNNQKNTHKSCNFCHSEEGKPRPVGNYIVQLKEVNVLGTKKMACQSCYRKTVRILKSQHQLSEPMYSSFKLRLQKLVVKFYGFFIFLFLLSIDIMAQGTPGLPGFPSAPDAAPIDGGLGLLAVAGGAYALKKLRDKKVEDEQV